MLADKLKNIGIAISENQEPSGNNSVGLSDIDTNYELNDRYSGVGERIGETLGRTSYSLSHLDPVGNKYGKYNVHPNPINSQDELNKERARNQGLGEQLWRMGVQAVGSEIVLGTLKGFSDLVDFFINIGKEKGEDDYTNPFSKQMEEWQEDIRNTAEIYQEDPGKAWAVGDSGWWTSNLVSAASTASLLIPTTGVTKGLSYLGKLTKASKLTRGLAKGLYTANIVEKPATFAKKLNSTLEIATGAAVSRTMENYIESREVYKDVENTTKRKLNDMSEEERQTFFENNPELVGKSDDEIAKYVASVSADKTFQNDYAMLLFDFMQLKALGNLYKGVKTTPSTTATRIANKNAINALSESTSKNIIEDTFWNRRKEFFKHVLKNPKDGINMLGLDEGLEEMYQGIQTEKGKEFAEMMFNPTLSPRALKSYLTDGATWEQAFWGVLGGLAYKGVASGLASSRDFLKEQKLKYKNKKGKISDEQLTKMLMTQEKQRLGEINDRQAKLNELTNKIDLIQNGKNPFRIKEDSENEYDDFVDEAEKDSILEEVINDFITDLTLTANKNGNYELLKEYIKDPNFNKYFKEHNIDDVLSQQITDQIIKKADKVFEYYNNAYENVVGLVDEDNTYVADIVATTITRDRLRMDEYEYDMNHYFNEATKLDPDGEILTEDYKDKYRYHRAKKILEDIEEARKDKQIAHAEGKISKQALEQYNKEYDEEIVKTYEWLYNKLNKDIYNKDKTAKVNARDLIEGYRDENREISLLELNNALQLDINNSIIQYGTKDEGSERLRKLLATAIQREAAYDRAKREQPKKASDYEKLFGEINEGVLYLTNSKYKKALEKVRNYIANSEDLEQAERDLSSGEIDELSEELEILKIGHHHTEPLTQLIAMNIAMEKKKRKNDSNVTNNGTPAPTNVQTIVNNQSNNPPSTGKESQTNTTNATNTVATNNTTNTNNSGQTITQEELLERQAKQAEELEKNRQPNKMEAIVEGEVSDPFYDIINPINYYIFKNYKKKLEVLEEIIKNGINSEQYKNLREECIDYLISNKGLTREYIEDSIDEAIKQGLRLTGLKLNKANNQLGTAILDFVDSITKYADTNSIPVEESDAIVEKFMTEYLTNSWSALMMPKHGNKYIIQLEDLYEYLTTSYAQKLTKVDKKTADSIAKYIFYNLYTYIQNNSEIKSTDLGSNIVESYGETKSFIFVGRNFLKSTYKNPTLFFAKIHEENIRRKNEQEKLKNRANTFHIAETSGGARKEVMELARKGAKIRLVFPQNGNAISVRVANYVETSPGNYTESYTPTKKVNGSVDYKTQEIGFITQVKQDPNTGVYQKFITEIGFNYKISDNNGKIYSNFDDFYSILFDTLEGKNSDPDIKHFLDLCLATWKNAHILGSKIPIPLTPVDYKLIEKVISPIRADIAEPTPKHKILKEIGDILFYDGFGPDVTVAVRRGSYEEWKRGVYENYQWTHSLNAQKQTGRNVYYTVLPQAYFLEKQRNRPPLITEESRNISDPSLEFDSDEHPIVMLDRNGNFITDNGKVVNVDNPSILQTYGMGVVLTDPYGNKFVSPITEQERVSENKVIYEALQKEINDLIYGFQIGEKSFDELKESFSQLFSYKGKGMAKSNPFYGLGVAYNNKMISIYMNGDVKTPLLRIYKFKKGTNEEGTHILFTPNGSEDGTHKQSYRYQPDITKTIATTIANSVFFNTSKYAFDLAKRKTDTQQSNKYFRKENGKFIFEIGGYKEEFNSFTDFALRVGAFRVNQAKENGSYFSQKAEDDVLNIVEIQDEAAYDKTDITNPNNQYKKEHKPITQIFEGKEKGKKDVTPKQFLTAANIDKAQIDALTDREFPIIPSRVYYGSKRGKSKAYYKDGKVFITDTGLKAINEKPNEAVRLLIHEQIHARIAQTSILKRQGFINDILNIIEYTLETLDEKINDPNIAIEEQKLLVKIKDFLTSDKQFGKYYNAYKNNPTEANKQLLVEEWLAETFSQKVLINYLNNTNYKDEQIDINGDKSNKSIWQKIIDAILKIFGLNVADVKNNTIFAKQYMLFKDETITQTEIESNEEEQSGTEVKDEEETIEKITDPDAGYNWDSEDPLDAITDEIETNEERLIQEHIDNGNFDVNGVNTYGNLNDFISQFDIKLQPKIAKMVENGTIKFVCR